MKEKILELLPILIPIIIVELILFIYVMRHILTHENYKHGNRKLWIIVSIVLINYVGPILYLIFGKEDE